MPPSFWSNTIWYIMLAISSVITLIFTIIKSKNRKFTIAYTLATLGFVYMIEAVLVILFNAYDYYPKIVNDMFQDTVLGNIFSQVSIASTSAFAIVYNLSYGWYVLFAFIYYLIDVLFVKLGIYEHYWYKSIYTLIGFLPLFILIKTYYKKLIRSSKYIFHYMVLYSSVFAVSGNLIILPFKLMRIQIFNIDFFSDLSKDHTTTTIIWAFIFINILIYIYKKNYHWLFKISAFITLFLIQLGLYKWGFILYKDGWFIPATLIDFLGIYLLIIVMDNFLNTKPLVR